MVRRRTGGADHGLGRHLLVEDDHGGDDDDDALQVVADRVRHLVWGGWFSLGWFSLGWFSLGWFSLGWFWIV